MNQVIQTPSQHYYLSKLLGYDYVILYKPRKSITVVDALSRRGALPSSQFFLLTTPTFEFFNSLLVENQSFSYLQVLQDEVTHNSGRHPHLSIIDRTLYYKCKPF